MRMISSTQCYAQRNHALQVFAYIPSNGTARALHHSTVYEFPRTLVFHPTMSYHPYMTRSKFLISRRNYQSPIQLSPPSSPPTQFSPVSLPVASSNVPQRSDEWFSLRKDKLTTSAFSTSLGFWRGNRRAELWREKVFLPEPTFDSTAIAAMAWGVENEPKAIEQYKAITGREVSILGFAVHNEAKFDWLGASPDGILDCYPRGGILEVKCPYNKGKPELALPWQSMPYYYMPQVQGQMEIMDRDWVDLYCWTLNGSAIFRVLRDQEYWEVMHGILKDFWCGNVIPAREAIEKGNEEEARAYEPKEKHELTGLIISKSKMLASNAKMLCRDIGGHVEFFR